MGAWRTNGPSSTHRSRPGSGGLALQHDHRNLAWRGLRLVSGKPGNVGLLLFPDPLPLVAVRDAGLDAERLSADLDGELRLATMLWNHAGSLGAPPYDAKIAMSPP